MRRRAYIAAACTSITIAAGCVAMADHEDDNANDDSGEEIGQITVIDISSAKEQVQFDAQAVQTSITTESTAKVRLDHTNASDETIDVSIRDGEKYALTPQYSEGGPGLLLLPETAEPTRVEPDCVRPKETRFGTTLVHVVRPLAPGETISQEYDVWVDPDYDGCFPAGTHRFETEFGEFTLALD